jgi:hypothetical protein
VLLAAFAKPTSCSQPSSWKKIFFLQRLPGVVLPSVGVVQLCERSISSEQKNAYVRAPQLLKPASSLYSGVTIFSLQP